MNNQQFTQQQFYYDQQPTTLSVSEIFERSNAGKHLHREDKVKKSNIKIEINAEEFVEDYKTKMISTSEICEKLTDRLGEVFADYIGCREISYTDGPNIGIQLIFEWDPNRAPDPVKRLYALEAVGLIDVNINRELTPEELNILRYNGTQKVAQNVTRGFVDEKAAGFRLTNDAISVLNDQVVSYPGARNDNADNSNFRRDLITYEQSMSTRNLNLVVTGLTVESVLGFIYGQNYDYSVVPGSRARSQNLGYLLEVNQIDRKTVKQLLQKYVGITAAYDGLYRPARK